MKTLYVVPTPIGNIKDISQRAIETLRSVKQIICEDTRVTKKLFDLLHINYKDKEFLAYFAGQEQERFIKAFEMIESGNTVLVSDSGTPAINDPGENIIKFIRENLSDHIKIEVLPGPNAAITALAGSGHSTSKFMYLGFLPEIGEDRRNFLDSLKKINEVFTTTFIAYESVHRIENSVRDFVNVYGENCKLTICREISKMHEQIISGTPQELLGKIKSEEIVVKGEFTLVFTINPPLPL